MTAVESSHVDKSAWGPGPWQQEPDRIEWRSNGLACLIVRGPLGSLCGYVGINAGHPWHGKDFMQVDANVHGGLTYADKCQVGGHICHVPQPGESDDVWWLGFDCAHSGDLSPGMNASLPPDFRSRGEWYESYKPVEYVRGYVESLVAQAIAARPA